MEALYLLVPLSVLIIFIAIYVFFSMSDSGQFDDMVGPALRILQDDDLPAEPDTSTGTNAATTTSTVSADPRNPPGPI